MVATQAALKHMNNGGRIIKIGSCVGERMMTPGLVAYSATKGAVKMFTQGLSREVGDRGITVNNVQPGPIDTDLNPAVAIGRAPKGRHSAEPLRDRLKRCGAGRVRRQPGSVIYHWCEFDRGWRHQRVIWLSRSNRAA